MKSNTKATLKLRAHSIRNLTAAELRAAHGGKSFDGTNPHSANGSQASIKTPPPPAPHRAK